jgi:AraC family transcriptional regulator
MVRRSRPAYRESTAYCAITMELRMNPAPCAASVAISVGFLHAAEHDEEDEHQLDGVEILVPGEGGAVTAVYRTDDGTERKAYLCAPMIAVIPHDARCAVHCRRPADTLVVRIAPDFYEAQARAALNGAMPQPLMARYASLDPFVRGLARELQDEMDRGRAPAEAYLNAMAEVLAVHLARHYTTAAPTPAATGLAQHKVKAVQSFVREHIAETIHVDALAAAVHMSPFHFARMFKQSVGQTPHLYVVLQRVETAKELLRKSDEPLIEVAAQAGFRTQGHFTGVFHRYTGYTPHVFRISSRSAQEA